jgi:hypothetical protein
MRQKLFNHALATTVNYRRTIITLARIIKEWYEQKIGQNYYMKVLWMDRKKELKLPYKQMKPEMGVFLIRCKVNNKCISAAQI